MQGTGVAVCITTLNEAESIGALIAGLWRCHTVIVADGGSTDATAALASNAGATVLGGRERRPISTALLYAFEAALKHNVDYIATIDAGGSHDPAELPLLLDMAYAGYDVVIGSRFVPGAKYHGRPARALLSRLAAVACNLAQPGAGYHDWTSGYRIYSRRAVEEILKHEYRAKMHGWQIETLAHCGAAGLSIIEAPITYHAGRSSFNRQVAAEAFKTWLHVLNHIGWRAA